MSLSSLNRLPTNNLVNDSSPFMEWLRQRPFLGDDNAISTAGDEESGASWQKRLFE
jgi:hypothetical protein